MELLTLESFNQEYKSYEEFINDCQKLKSGDIVGSEMINSMLEGLRDRLKRMKDKYVSKAKSAYDDVVSTLGRNR